MRTRHTWLLALSMTSAATAYSAPPCDAPEYGQFDFWIGDWQVFKPDGTLLLLDGSLQGSAMVMEGSTKDAAGAWVTAFDGLYRRVAD